MLATMLRALLAGASLAVSFGAHGACEPVPFVDAHVHLNDEAMQLELMQRFAIPQAVVFWGRNSDNAQVEAAARRHPERFLPFVSVSPERTAFRQAWERDDAALLDRLDRQLATGAFRGIGEISATHFASPGFAETDFSPLGPTMTGILELARKHGVPVLLHVEWTRLQELERLLERYRDVPVIWAHGGYTPMVVAGRLLERHSNLVYELSARTWAHHPRSPDYTILRDGERVWPEWLALIEAHPGRFIVGTDASHRSLASDVRKVESVQSFLCQLSPATRERVARRNLIALLADRPARAHGETPGNR